MRNHPANGAKNFCSCMSWRSCTVWRFAEVVDVGGIQIPLVQITRIAEEPEIDLPFSPSYSRNPTLGTCSSGFVFFWLSPAPWPTTNSPVQPSDTQTPVSS